MATYKIHPGIGIARLGNSDTEFYLGPETPAGLPMECDGNGNERLAPDGTTPVLVTNFRDAQGRIKRQAARFQVFVYDEDDPEGRPLKIGDDIEGGGNHGTLTAIYWRVYLANKKASWYRFDGTIGEHGYPPNYPRRNADVAPRDRLIIDPGPRTVGGDKRRASFDRGGEGNYATSFPPPLSPNSIDTLGDLLLDDAGPPRSSSAVTAAPDRSARATRGSRTTTPTMTDGTTMFRTGPSWPGLSCIRGRCTRPYISDVEYPAWWVVGYRAASRKSLTLVTMDEVLVDLFLQNFACDTGLYRRLGSFGDPERIGFRQRRETSLSQ